MADVENKRTDFFALLVYDVSRWGRFQDVDESTYYENVLKRASMRTMLEGPHTSSDGVRSDGQTWMSDVDRRPYRVSRDAAQKRALGILHKLGWSSVRTIRFSFVHPRSKNQSLSTRCLVVCEAWRSKLSLDPDRHAKRIGKPLSGISRDSMHCLSEAVLLDRCREGGSGQRSAYGLDHSATLEAPLCAILRVSPKGTCNPREGVYMNRLDLLWNQPTAHYDN